MSALHASGFPEDEIRARARHGAARVFPPASAYGRELFGGGRPAADDVLDRTRLVPPAFVPRRLEKLIELAREPLYRDVDTATDIGGLRAALPVYVSAFGSTQVASRDLGVAAARQAARLGLPLVVGENIGPVNGTGRLGEREGRTLLGRVRAYQDALEDGGGVAVQQSTEDADAEIWNLVYSDTSVQPLLAAGRLAFELKVGQGAKPGLGGMTLVGAADAERLQEQYAVEPLPGDGGADRALRSGSPGTFTQEILAHQVRLMRNNFPRARIWVKLPPARDVGEAAATAWAAGADSVTVDGAEGGTGWAPLAFLDDVGLPLGECLRRVRPGPAHCLLVSGRIWEGARAAKALAAGARAVGLGRAALLAVDEDPDAGLDRLIAALALELRLLTSALGKYRTGDLDTEDLWHPEAPHPAAQPLPAAAHLH
ncbi:ferredoxin-dependent glutamate synthase [Streptomyces zinciresistens K42]|uniref:Ferredoxin-dependent glutamate synthase n=1 Tax=Streptomyces zinciresistens K42 TaxID=700597 RepID=G2GEQ9_9ACTN|nr:glutamate synthase-related protein [Streptomyces zinciresistens]EGX58020.1 ferredoxin-dependent glutamate synthase [Streptomyces zinciresistens K42]